MNVLLVNPGYPQTFWSYNQVLQMLGKKVLTPPLGLLTVAALLPQDWNMTLVELSVREITEAEWDQADIVMVTGMYTQCLGIAQTIKQGKQRGKTVVVGGAWVFHVPHEALALGADYVVRGEAELAMPLLLEAMASGRKGLIIEAADKPDMTESPAPRYDLLDLDLYIEGAIQFSRGCPFHCEFCDITLMFGRKVRTKTPAQVIRELQAFYDLGWRRNVAFIDDNLIGNTSRARAMLKELIPWMEQRGHPFDFSTQVSVNLASSPELLDLMARAGFYRVFVGIETLDQDSLQQAKKYQNSGIDLDQACERMTKAGLQVIAGCIIGFDNEKPGADQRLIDFAQRTQMPELFVSLLQAAPGTLLHERLVADGRLLEGYDENAGSQTALMNFVPTRPLQEIVNEFTRVYEVIYDPGPYVERVVQHLARMDPTPFAKRLALPYRSELRAVGIAIYRQGIRYPSRGKFWRSFVKALITFPTRLRFFFSYCIMGEHYFEYRRTVKGQLQAQLDRRDSR